MRKVILFYNTMWDLPLGHPPEAIPAPYELTTDRNAADEAVAIVFHLPTLPPTLIRKQLTKKKGQLWVAWCLECDVHLPQMKDPSFIDRFDITMTYKLDADVAVTYLEPNLPERLRRPPADKEDGKLVNAFISSAYNQSRRIEFLLQLMPHIDVHSYGRVFRNRHLAEDCGRKTKLKTIEAYKFTLAFENAIAKDYVTENSTTHSSPGRCRSILVHQTLRTSRPGTVASSMPLIGRALKLWRDISLRWRAMSSSMQVISIGKRNPSALSFPS